MSDREIRASVRALTSGGVPLDALVHVYRYLLDHGLPQSILHYEWLGAFARQRAEPNKSGWFPEYEDNMRCPRGHFWLADTPHGQEPRFELESIHAGVNELYVTMYPDRATVDGDELGESVRLVDGSSYVIVNCLECGANWPLTGNAEWA
jgi:hypothetical protein